MSSLPAQSLAGEVEVVAEGLAAVVVVHPQGVLVAEGDAVEETVGALVLTLGLCPSKHEFAIGLLVDYDHGVAAGLEEGGSVFPAVGFVLGAGDVLDEAALFLKLVHLHALCCGEGVRVVAEPPFDRIVCEIDVVRDEAQCRVVPEDLEHQLPVRKVHAADKCFVGASLDPVGESVGVAAYVLAAEGELHV